VGEARITISRSENAELRGMPQAMFLLILRNF
jgi:hypothetical protein